MPRSSGGRSRSSSPNRGSFSMGSQRPSQMSFRPTPSRTTAPPPPTTATQTRSSGPGFGSTLAQGVAFGAGSEIGHQALRGIFGGPSSYQNQPIGNESQQQQQPAQYQDGSNQYQGSSNQIRNYCEAENTDFIKCLQQNTDSIGMCQAYLDVFKECEKKHKTQSST